MAAQLQGCEEEMGRDKERHEEGCHGVGCQLHMRRAKGGDRIYVTCMDATCHRIE